MIKITQSNKKEYIGKDFIFNNRKDKIVIGWKVFGIGKNFEIACDDVKEFKVLDENSKALKTTSAMKKAGGAVVGGLLTGGVGAIIGALISGNNTKKNLKINLGFKLKNKDWFIVTLDVDDVESFSGGIDKSIVEEVLKRFAVKSEAPF
ncbi:hypothetical protein OAT35_01705 [Candidatus Pelagibacter sp.]|jgi:hypothetical protein|nr:hypothetical protein [Candidatus Pelagibacter sp.]